ncbi:unnamed protein product [Rhodiola kirilowii]
MLGEDFEPWIVCNTQEGAPLGYHLTSNSNQDLKSHLEDLYINSAMIVIPQSC